jgi:CubicO group peptidase (beta-lactamase class C family)
MRMSRIIVKKGLALMICFVWSCILIGNDITFSAANTTDKVDTLKIDEFVKEKMKSEKIPGVSLAVVKGNQIIYLKGYGVADTSGTPVTPETPFIIGSLSKSFTAVAIMQLKEKGKIDIDAPVQRYLPWFCLADPKASKTITIKNLLSQTSGILKYSDSENYEMSIEQVVRNQKKTQIVQPVNSTFQYSNINYIILGEVIQTVTGEPYEKYIEKNIFNPLEMKNSYTSSEEAEKHGLSRGYRSFFGLMLPMKQGVHTASVPAGYLISSSEDMAHYLIAEMNNGIYEGNTILSKDGMKETHNPISNVKNIMGLIKFTGSYGMGWFIDNKDNLLHGGDVENFHSYIEIVKLQDMGIVMLFNSNDYIATLISKNEAYEDISKGVISILKGEKPIDNSSLDRERSVINVIGILAIILLLASFYGLFKWNKRLKANKINITPNIILITTINIVIPLLISFFIHTSLESLMPYIPDFTGLIIFLLFVLFITGTVKMVLLLIYRKNRKSANTSTDIDENVVDKN